MSESDPSHLNKPDIAELAGQRLMLGFDGTHLNDELKIIIREFKAGGIILFKPNVETPEQVAMLNRDCMDYAESQGCLPLIISVDQEGGTVARLKEGFTQFGGNPEIGNEADAQNMAFGMSEELKKAGFNMNLAPVLDIAPDGIDSIMKQRAFPGDAETVSRLGIKMIQTYQNHGIMAVAKHFPGIGRTVLDSHFHLPKLDIDLKTLEGSDLIPFLDAIQADVSGMMLSHIYYPQLDAEWQASLSPAIARDLLRNQLGYDGLVMTDDLDMKAIGHDMPTCIRQILRADIDMALICHKGPNIQIAVDETRRQIDQDPDLYQRALVSYERIKRYKQKYLG